MSRYVTIAVLLLSLQSFGASKVVSVASGYWHNIAMRADGSVVSWGSITTVPAGTSGVLGIAAGGRSNCVIKADKKVSWWGDPDGAVDAVPATLSNVKMVAGGGYHYLALKNDSTVVAWGEGGPINVPSTLQKAVYIAAAPHFSAAIKPDGSVVSWGDEGHGGTVPAGLTDVVSIACGRYHMLALKSDGTVVGWGTPSTLSQARVPAGLKAKAIGASFELSMAIKLDGTLVVWGVDPNGKRPPASLSNLVAVTGGYTHAIALAADGSMVAWGDNGGGQCDIPSSITSINPAVKYSIDFADMRDTRAAYGTLNVFTVAGRALPRVVQSAVSTQSSGFAVFRNASDSGMRMVNQ